MKKYVTIFFDFEGKWGMPFEAEYDLEKTTLNILKILKKYKIKAVFNTCGKIIEVFPNVIKQINKDGHEISLHGYEHEKFNKIKLKELDKLLSKSERNLINLIGKRPIGFRAPYLLGPNFYNKEIYQLFKQRGYEWCSNREIRFVEELFVQHRLKGSFYNLKNIFSKIVYLSKLTKTKRGSRFLFILLNAKLILTENIKNVLNEKLIFEEIKYNLRFLRNFYWLSDYKSPILKSNILDFPVCSPLDCDLLGLPIPSQNSNKITIDYAYNCLINNFKDSKYFFNLNFHDWIIGTSNRIELFDRILNYLSHQKSVKIVLSKELLDISKKRRNKKLRGAYK